jgi:ABC-type sugar transport system permease subunit
MSKVLIEPAAAAPRARGLAWHRIIHWLGYPDLAMLSVIMANVWRGFPFFGVSFLAAMREREHSPHKRYPT